MLGGREVGGTPDLDRDVADGHLHHVLHRAEGPLDGVGLGVEQAGDDLGEAGRLGQHRAGGQHVADRLVDQRVLGAGRAADRRAARGLDQPGDVDQPPALGGVQHQLVRDGLDPGEDLQAEDVHPGGPALARQRGQRARSVRKRAAHAPQVHVGPLPRLRPHSTSVATSVARRDCGSKAGVFRG